MNFLPLRRLPLHSFAALLLGTATAHAAPTPSLQGLEVGIWSVISDNDLNPNQTVTDFGNVDVGATNDRRYRLRNIGDGFFNWEGASSSNGQFVILNSSGGAQAFPIPIAGGTNREFIIRFAPTTPGTVSPTITLETNLTSLNAEYTFAVTGTGQAPDARISGRQGGSGGYTTINDGDTTPRLTDGTDFGFIPTGSSVTRDFELTNTGNQTLNPGSAFFVGGSSSQFNINGLTFGNLAPGASRTFSITFTPTSVGVKTTTFQFVSDDPDENPYDFTVTGEGVAFPSLRVRGLQGAIPTDIDDGDLVPDQQVTQYGNVTVGSPGSRTFRLVNDGNATLTISSITSSSPRFTIPAQPTTVATGASVDFVIVFTPTGPGTVNPTITINSNTPGAGNPYTFALTGTGVAPDARISGRQGSSGGYTIITDGDKTPSLTDGTDFSFIPVGASVTRDFELTNTGNDKLNPGSAFFVDGDDSQFQINGLTFGSLAAGASRLFSITFTPESAGVKTTTFQFVSDDPDENPYDFTVTGEGLAFPEIVVQGRRTGGVAQTLSDIDDGSVAVFASNGTLLPTTNWGAVGTSLFRISNTGEAALTLGAPVISGPDAGLFTIPAFSTANIAPDGFRDFVINFTPVSLGTKTAMISFGNNDPNENPFNFALAGDATGGPDIKVEGYNSVFEDNGFVGIADGDLTPDQLVVNFGSVNIGDERLRRYELRNTGTADLIITAIMSSSPDFEMRNAFAPGALPLTLSTTRDSVLDPIVFIPTARGEQTSIITILSNDPDDENPYTFAIKGTGRAPDIVVAGAGPSYLQVIPNGDTTSQSADGTFLGVAAVVGETQARGFRIKNEGNRRLQLLGATITGSEASDFSILYYENTSVQQGDYVDFLIEFDPSANGVRNATVEIVSDDPFKMIYTFAISGTGGAPPFPPSIIIKGAGMEILNGASSPSTRTGTDFGTLMLGAAPLTRTFQISNSSIQTLNVFDVSSNHPAFEITRVTGYTLEQMGRIDFDVTFTPLSGGPANAIITVINDDPQNASYTFAVGATTVGIPTPPTIGGLDLDADNGGGEITIIGAPGTSLRLASSTTLEDGSWGVVPGYEAIGTTGSPQVLSLTGLVDPETIPRIYFRLEEN